QTFTAPSDTEPFRTPGGRVVPGRVRPNMTAEQYQMEIMQSRIASDPGRARLRQPGDEAAALITKMIRANAFTDGETRNVLSVIARRSKRRTAFHPRRRTRPQRYPCCETWRMPPSRRA